MKIDIITIFPQQIEQYTEFGIFRIAKEKKAVDINVHDLRKWTDDNHKTIDDRPFGGGAGMVMKVEPVYKAINELKKKGSIVIATTPQGKPLKQKMLRDLSKEVDCHYIFLCGHYEGFDQRIIDNLVDIEISIGDYVLSGGELPVLTIIDGILRLLPNVLGNEQSSINESFTENTLEYPQYTRPEEFMGWKVPPVLLKGNHSQIALWRDQKAKEITLKKRPDIVKS
ncbi:MAG: tRNA (guanine-N(1)-)-methyltransferase [candidate division WS6 bacterium GW2011_GWF2_39_15]|uniref:tRNA (guanine-N(1)-)-methyltransferase n=1 Tax=candidate division WS6 bacterium GW2011_GWF2_39_15 TaxID=1619100 RepID=A0A0G0MNR2_9BACT|nr:MAG: tRNA (guanine-N(1)-)-methyltransferase [candidate division WS6 bacterium GW2011_GWF2_39_15]